MVPFGNSFAEDCYDECYKFYKNQKKIRPYIAFSGSYPIYSKIDSDNFAEGSPSKKFMGHAAVGIMIKDKMAAEIEAIYYETKYSTIISNGSTTVDYDLKRTTNILLNGYYYFNTNYSDYNIDPFIGVGAGVSHSEDQTIARIITASKFVVMKRDKYDFAYQILLGVSTEISKDFYLESKIRWLSLGNFGDDVDTGRFNNIFISVGVKYLF